MRKRSEIAKPAEDADVPKPEESSPAMGEAPAYEFPTANARHTAELRPDFQRVVETTFAKDVHTSTKRLRAALSVGNDRSDHGSLNRALDDAEKNAHEAYVNFVTAKLDFERWELENEVTNAAMWNAAVISLQEDKESGARTKQITDADVRAKCASLHPDEWRAQEHKRRTVKLAVDILGNLSEQWSSRCRSLAGMLAKLRG